ncbi:MAG: transcriptional regulator [Pseudonocardiaceae bacterium]
MSPMWRFALSRRWWAGHVLVAAGCGVFLELAHWQWDRAYSVTGDWQNLGYALQWPLFAAVLVAGWLRFLWLEQHPPSPDRDTALNRTPWIPPPPSLAATRGPASREDSRKDDADDELAEYNAYLTRLAERDRGR